MSNESTPTKRTDLPSKILAMPGVDRYAMKVIAWAAPMKLGAYASIRGVEVPPEEDPQADGFLVEQAGTVPNAEGFGGSIVWMVSPYFNGKFEVDRVIKETTYVDRMMNELCETSDRVQKLEAFLKTEKFSTLATAEQQDMRGQLSGMQDHLWFLSRRVRRLGESNVNA